MRYAYHCSCGHVGEVGEEACGLEGRDVLCSQCGRLATLMPQAAGWTAPMGRGMSVTTDDLVREADARSAAINKEKERKMALECNLQFESGPLPVRDDGALALVKLRPEAMAACGLEYYGQPVVVSRWSCKLKTTLDPLRLSYEDVAGWIEI